jgi:putative Holliday junction resolvase
MALPLLASPSLQKCPGTGAILAIVYGQKRLGLALSDEHGMVSRPFAIWTRINRRRDLARLRELVRQHGVQRIIVGLPLRLDGKESDMSAGTKAFAARIEKALGIPVETVDERLTSWEAKQSVQENSFTASPGRAGKHRKKDKGQTTFDDVAAAIILRDYLCRTHPQAHLQMETRD